MLLIDTNIFVESLLGQERAEEVDRFFERVPPEEITVSDFSLYSIGIILERKRKAEIFVKFIEGLFPDPVSQPLRLEVSELPLVIKTITAWKLDFDDAYQYTLAEKHDLTLVSFDADFDKTARGRKTPQAILREMS